MRDEWHEYCWLTRGGAARRRCDLLCSLAAIDVHGLGGMSLLWHGPPDGQADACFPHFCPWFNPMYSAGVLGIGARGGSPGTPPSLTPLASDTCNRRMRSGLFRPVYSLCMLRSLGMVFCRRSGCHCVLCCTCSQERRRVTVS